MFKFWLESMDEESLINLLGDLMSITSAECWFNPWQAGTDQIIPRMSQPKSVSRRWADGSLPTQRTWIMRTIADKVGGWASLKRNSDFEYTKFDPFPSPRWALDEMAFWRKRQRDGIPKLFKGDIRVGNLSWLNGCSENELIHLLGDMMTIVSEDAYCANWMGNTGDVVPELCRRVLDKRFDQPWADGYLSVPQAYVIQAIADRLGSWVDFPRNGEWTSEYVRYTPGPIPDSVTEELDRSLAQAKKYFGNVH
jgi:hypothetical protein